MIHYISPYSLEKNIGGAINKAVKQLSPAPDDWIVHTDHDTMFLLPDSKRQMEEIMNDTKFDVLGPMTNRLAADHQLFKGVFDCTDIREHIEFAEMVSDLGYGRVAPTYKALAAFCLCFRYSVWEKIGGFEENTINFDSRFSTRARNKGFKTGIMTGVYAFHVYRMGKDHKDYSHLI